MNIKFEKVILHNFLSFGDAEVLLSERGYCVVNGINNCKKDSALSNGSGKSSIWSAISYALTGSTIQGLKSNIANIYGKDGCFVKLLFQIDSDYYEITRYKDYSSIGTDLKIIINGEDKSGKGIRESQQLLEQYLPDITTELLGSVIILGQGLPHKFSNNSPSGRKEVLEKLSKSDFMIEDIKQRITKRSNELATTKRTLEDSLLKANTQEKLYTEELSKENTKLLAYQVMPDFDHDINIKNQDIKDIDEQYDKVREDSTSTTNAQTETNDGLLTLISQKATDTTALREDYNLKVSDIKVTLSKLEAEQTHTKEEIAKLDAIKDVCPTCGQKIPNVCKHDTTQLKENLADLVKRQEVEREKEKELLKTYNEKLTSITTQYSEAEKVYRDRLTELRTSLKTMTDRMDKWIREKNTLVSEIQKLKNSKTTFETSKKQIEDKIVSIKETIKSIQDKISNINKESVTLNSHILVVDKMNTLVKRDFRGFLLSSVIDFISKKAKEYAKDIFGTDELEFKLDGNDIDISYCGKAFENLSGGEKQRVDLILQFAIRDMMSQYLSFTSNILVLDEIFDGLDIMGTTNVLNLISKRLTDVGSIFIISHNDSLEIPYDDTITVVKDEKGVSRVI